MQDFQTTFYQVKSKKYVKKIIHFSKSMNSVLSWKDTWQVQIEENSTKYFTNSLQMCQSQEKQGKTEELSHTEEIWI